MAIAVDKKKEQQAALAKIKAGLATKVRILVGDHACPVCTTLEGVYDFDDVPELPHEGCSHLDGCRCFYAPVLDRWGP